MGSEVDSEVILIVQDALLRRSVIASLEGADFAVREFSELRYAMKALAAGIAMYVLMDIDFSLDECLGAIRDIQSWSSVSVLTLSSRSDELAKIKVLDAGACDYLVKPLGLGELAARLRAIRRERRRMLQRDKAPLNLGDITVDFDQRLVTRSGRRIHLTPIEYQLLFHLGKNLNSVMTHSQLLEAVWGAEHRGDIAYLRVFVNQLRRKIEGDASKPRMLLTEMGVGYRLMSQGKWPVEFGAL